LYYLSYFSRYYYCFIHNTLKRAIISTIFWMVMTLAIWVFWSCASTKKNPFSKAYHNTTAHYNAYFIAREEMKEIEASIEQNSQRNFNKILGVFPDIDSAIIDPLRSKLTDVMKKGSLVIQLHENSQWVDDSYFLIGKARFYGGQFVEAIETFKYVNTRSQEDDTRQKALIALMRTFIHYNEFNNAIAVADYLKKEKLNRANSIEVNLTNAYMYQLAGDYKNMIKHLSKAVKDEGKKMHAARHYFVIGQVYQHLNSDSAAFASYKKCLKSNPDYELSFYAKLYMAQVTEPDLKANLKKIRKYFKKLLNDDKNLEYRDKIFYEMGKFELNHENTDLAVQHLRSSLREPLNHPVQKAYSYLELGGLYYDHYKNFEMAQAYYDSTVRVMPTDDERYESIKKRSEVLNEFVEQLKTIQLQDSLLALAKVDPQQLSNMLDTVLLVREESRKEAEKQLKRQQKQQMSNANTYNNNNIYTGQNNPFGNSNEQAQGSDTQSTWYFYNMAVVSTGQSEFVRRWGNRPLEDNWRRSKKEANISFVEDQTPVETDTLVEKVTVDTSNPEAEKEKLMATIPFSDEAKALALEKIEDAYFNLGNIYHFKLLEEKNAIETYNLLLQRFPGSEYEPETYYTLYLVYKNKDENLATTYKEKLTSKYPETMFAKLAINPNYKKESDEASRRLERMYEIAYKYYKENNYDQARPLVARGIELYPDNPFTDKLRILSIMIDGKLEGETKYQFELQEFIDTYPESSMKEYAQTLLDAKRNFVVKEAQKHGAKYYAYFAQPHFFIIVYKNNLKIADKLSNTMDQYLMKNYPKKGLNTGSLTFNDEQSLLLINKLDDKNDASKFLKRFEKEGPLSDLLNDTDYKIFVITEDNFEIFYKTKRLEDYLKFYQQYYR